MDQSELPAFMMMTDAQVQSIVDSFKPEAIDTETSGRGRREKKDVSYADTLSEEAWLMAVDKGELDEAEAKAAARKKLKRERGEPDSDHGDEQFEPIETEPPKRKRKRTPKGAAAAAASNTSSPATTDPLKLTMKLGSNSSSPAPLPIKVSLPTMIAAPPTDAPVAMLAPLTTAAFAPPIAAVLAPTSVPIIPDFTQGGAAAGMAVGMDMGMGMGMPIPMGMGMPIPMGMGIGMDIAPPPDAMFAMQPLQPMQGGLALSSLGGGGGVLPAPIAFIPPPMMDIGAVGNVGTAMDGSYGQAPAE
jgi:hypothetical protein